MLLAPVRRKDPKAHGVLPVGQGYLRVWEVASHARRVSRREERADEYFILVGLFQFNYFESS